MADLSADVIVVGGGTGGVAAALGAVRLGASVVMTESTDWIGGQLTSQAVPPDEHRWIESHGATNSYRQFREGVRGYYRRHYPMTGEARQRVHLNPGGGYVSPLCHEPRVAHAVLESMLAPYVSSGQVRLLMGAEPVGAVCDGDRVAAVETSDGTVLRGSYFIDATELGDLLPLAGAEYVMGAESQDETGELHALPGPADPLDQQAITWCFALDHFEGEDHTVERPADYDFWRSYHADFWPGPLLDWKVVLPTSMITARWQLFDPTFPDLWHFRRILQADLFAPGAFRSDITLVNWPQTDYWLGPLVGVNPETAAGHREACRQLSLSFLHWMQTEAGYPGLRLRPDVMGTADGMAKHVYVRESRRIRAETTVLEQHVGVDQRGSLVGAEQFPDSVGIGSYRIDLHPSTGLRSYIDISCYPFQIPLGALLPVRVENLLAGGKNLGVTHITNGCYRLHPVEWNVGEVAGMLAAHCIGADLTPHQVRNDARRLDDFQRVLRGAGIPLEWPEFARVTAV